MSDAAEARATIVVVARDRFSKAQESLESVFANTPEPFDLIYVDAGSPAPVKRWLEEQAASHGFELIRRDHYLATNVARMIGARLAKTEYIVFLDNDVVVAPRWLGALVDCADASGAAVVGPLTCEGDFNTIHFAGGEVTVSEEQENGATVRHLRDRMYLAQRKVEDVREQLKRAQCSLTEYHCVLVRRDSLERVGGLDPMMLSTREHVDLCLAIMETGDTVWFEPESVVCFLGTTPLKPSDLEFYCLRWSDDWQLRSLEHFRDKWHLADDEFFWSRLAKLDWRRRTYVIGPIARRLSFGRGSKRLERALVPLEHRVNAWIARRNAHARPEAPA